MDLFLEPDSVPGPYLLGKVFGLCMELAGFPVLHGSCLNVLGTGIGLLGFSGMGKSTLSAALRARGCPLITDDLIPIDPKPPHRVAPGIPLSRMWPDTAAHFIPHHQTLEKVHPNFLKVKIPDKLGGVARFDDQARSLGAVFILERRMEPCVPRIERINPAGALMELVRHSYHPDLVRAIGLQQVRLGVLALLMTAAPVFRLTYPSGFEQLSQVCDMILAQAGSLSITP